MGIWSFIFGQKPAEVHPSQYERAELVTGNEIFKLVTIGNKHSALFFDAGNNKTYEVFSSKNAEAAGRRFDVLKYKFPKLVCNLEYPINVAFISKVLDLIEKYPQYSLTHLAVLLGDNNEENTDSSLYKYVNELLPDSGMSPLQLAIKIENVSMVRQLLKIGARTFEVDSNGWTAFHYAAKSKHVEILEMLGSKDASAIDHLNKVGETALHIACAHGMVNNVGMLLKFNADPFITRSSKYPIHCAIYSDNIEMVNLLCAKDPRVLHLKDTSFGNTPMHWFKSKEMYICMRKFECDFEMKNMAGETPLACKVKEGDFKNSLLLLVEGFDATAINNRGNSMIHHAIELDRPDMVQMLIGFGAKVNVVNKDGVSQRHRAAGSQGHNKDLILQYLHLAGAKRCSHLMRDCVVGCAHNAEYNGTPFDEGLTYDINVFDFWLESDILNEALSKEPERSEGFGDAILTLDGGGVRGIVTAVILMALEEEAKAKTHDLFDVIGGTSTGGILAMGIVHKRPVRYIMSSYFKLKNDVFHGKRPYNEEIIERFLKEEFGSNTKMIEVSYPKVMLMTVLADRMPAELFTFKNFDIPGMYEPHHSFDKRFKPAPKPKDQYVWQAVRATCAATTYFKPSGRFIDGAFIANNPTLDVLTEMFRYNKLNEVVTKTKSKPMYVVVSIGTGRPQQKQVEVCDFARPENIQDLAKAFAGFWNIGEMMIDQVTRPDGHIVRRAAAWCGMLGVPFYRFNPVIVGHVALDCTDDLALCGIMWETQCFIYQNINAIRRLARYLVRKKESRNKS